MWTLKLREFAQEEITRQVQGAPPARRAENPDCHRQIEGRALFLHGRRREIDRDVLRRQIVSAIAQSGLDSLAAFPHRGVWKPDRHQCELLPGAEIHLHRYRVGVDPEYRSRLDAKEHSAVPPFYPTAKPGFERRILAALLPSR